MANISHFTQTVNGVSTTYDIHDANAIPKTGSNQISGDLIPSTDNSIDIGSSTNNIKMLYTKGITIDAKTIDTDANGNMTYDGHIVDTIEEQGTGYIRYSNGIQICYGKATNTNTLAAGTTRFSFPKIFSITPSVIATPDISAGYVCTAFAEGASTWVLNVCTVANGVLQKTPDPVPCSYVAIGTWK